MHLSTFKIHDILFHTYWTLCSINHILLNKYLVWAYTKETRVADSVDDKTKKYFWNVTPTFVSAANMAIWSLNFCFRSHLKKIRLFTKWCHRCLWQYRYQKIQSIKILSINILIENFLYLPVYTLVKFNRIKKIEWSKDSISINWFISWKKHILDKL